MEADDQHAERARAAVELLAANRAALLRVARRVSICRDDAEDALQRATLIALTKAPPLPPGRLAAWMNVVIRREAFAVRKARERLLGSIAPPAALEHDPLELVACERPGPLEALDRRDRVGEAAALLGGLKRDQRTALLLQAAGYSYAEIAALRSWTYTKVNRSLAEGRARLRSLAGAACGIEPSRPVRSRQWQP